MRFWSGITRGGERYGARKGCCRAPSTPKPGHLTQSPHLGLWALGGKGPTSISQGAVGIPGIARRVQAPVGMVAGSVDRALEGKARVPGTQRTQGLTPRVIALQNRMRLTQSPGREVPQRNSVSPHVSPKTQKNTQQGSVMPAI
jgi:hypothetical protein